MVSSLDDERLVNSQVDIISSKSRTSAKLVSGIPVHVDILIIVSPIVIRGSASPVIRILAQGIVVPGVTQVPGPTGR